MFWDGGPSKLSAFVKSHVCNELCDYLYLDDLDDWDFEEIAKEVGVEKADEWKQDQNVPTRRDSEAPDLVNSSTD
jgi:hypothetical protein